MRDREIQREVEMERNKERERERERMRQRETERDTERAKINEGRRGRRVFDGNTKQKDLCDRFDV